VGQFDKEASRTRDYCAAKAALLRASLAQGRLKSASRGSPRSFTAQKTLVQDDKQTEPLLGDEVIVKKARPKGRA
jgi:hypothetical protein